MKTQATPNPKDEAFVYLESFDRKTRQLGESYFRDSKVEKIRLISTPDMMAIEARVRGTSNYQVTLSFTEDGWDGECTCPVSFDCKHCYAAMLEADEIELLDSEGEKKTALSFLKEARQRLDRSLSPSEMRACNAVDTLYELFRDEKQIDATLLNPILNEESEEEKMVELWPAPPESPWQAWLYVLAYVDANKLSCMEGLQPLADWAEAAKLVRTWRRQQRVEHWRAWLKKAAKRTPATRDLPQLELRVRLTSQGAQLEALKSGARDFMPVKQALYSQLLSAGQQGTLPLSGQSLQLWRIFNTGYDSTPLHPFGAPDTARVLNQLLRTAELEERVLGPQAQPLTSAKEPLAWRVDPPEEPEGDYRFYFVLPDGALPPHPLLLLDGTPSLYLTAKTVFSGPPLGSLVHEKMPLSMPADALETADGIALLDRLGIEPPEPLASKMRTLRLRVVFSCRLEEDHLGEGERLLVEINARNEAQAVLARYERDGWHDQEEHSGLEATRIDSSALDAVPQLVEALRLIWDPYSKNWRRSAGRQFPNQFSEWLETLPSGVEIELDPVLATLREQPIEAQIKLDVQEAGIDWFDLRIMLDVADATLSAKEIRALMEARGGFVRLGKKGWARLQFELSEQEETQLADLGLSARDFSSAPQRMHALQLAGRKATERFFSKDQAALIERKASEILTRVTPPPTADLNAQLRPYQLEGYHFLAYLAANSFGGILADDMGLGKTLQTLAWLLWIRQEDSKAHPSLVVCPKSVTATWATEAARFAPNLRLTVLERGANKAATVEKARARADVVVVNYTQLRLLQEAFTAAPWHAVILDEAQYIKNPQSQTAKAAFALKARHRLALSGTPIENQLFDLWSLMNFAMPGVLGPQANFKKLFDQRNDPLARRRLAARVRPFVLRRTKGEVAKDLPERTEEDLLCELEGQQATLYSAELKRARAALLRIESQSDLDRERFHILTSLLRLRQICCHPALVGTPAAEAESAKFSALMDLLEPLIEEGHKVLVFSQFVQMLNLVQQEVQRRGWTHFLLTGETEERSEMVDAFQGHEGSAVFLISLRAGGFGLNLTAASYVVLYDPWWNPAVENQAIDRTHRIGQVRHVIAYRLLMKSTIEEKIRQLQKQKHALAEDILGEESLARTLTLEDFRFLLTE